jgi:hypothetical protein
MSQLAFPSRFLRFLLLEIDVKSEITSSLLREFRQDIG